MGHRTLLVLVVGLGVCAGQTVRFGTMLHGFSAVKPALDSRGNLVHLTDTLAVGFCCGVGTGLVTLVERYDRDGSSRVLADTFMGGTRDASAVVVVDGRDRVYVGANREGWPVVARFVPDAARAEVLARGMRLVGIGFALNDGVENPAGAGNLVPGRTEAVMTVRFRVLDGVSGAVRFAIVPDYVSQFLGLGSVVFVK